MSTNDLPTDHEYLEQLMRGAWTPLPRELQEIQRQYWREAVKEGIANGALREDLLEFYLQTLNEQHNPDLLFQGGALKSLKGLAVACLTDEEASLLKDEPVGVLCTTELNAFAIRTPREGAAIAIYASLWPYLKISFTCILGVALRESRSPIAAHHSDETYAINLLQTVNVIKSGALMVIALTGEHSIEDCIGAGSRPNQIILANMNHALTFVLLHEYGHIWRGHLHSQMTRTKTRGDDTLQIYLTSHEQEYEADQFAIAHLWRGGSENLRENCSKLIAVSMLFHLLDLCEEGEASELIGTHPRSRQRLEAIYAACREFSGDEAWQTIETMKSYLEQLFDNFQEFGRSALDLE